MVLENARAKRALSGAICLVAMMESMLEWGLDKANRSRTLNDRVFYLTTAAKNFDVARSSLDADHPISRALAACKGKTVFAFAGTFNRSQHPDMLLDAIENLNASGQIKGRNAAFLIGGTGLGADEVMRRAAALPDTHVVGWMKPHEMNAFLGGANVGLLLQRESSEAFNNKTFSYLASGLPIISCATGDLHEIIEQKKVGMNIRGGDPDGLAKAMLQFLDDPAKLTMMSNNARRLFSEAFDQDSNYSAYADHVIAMAEHKAAMRPDMAA